MQGLNFAVRPPRSALPAVLKRDKFHRLNPVSSSRLSPVSSSQPAIH